MDYQNDEDSIAHPGKLREDLQGLIGSRGSGGAPSNATLALARSIDVTYSATMDAVSRYFTTEVAPVDARLVAAQAAPLAETIVEKPIDCATDEER